MNARGKNLTRCGARAVVAAAFLVPSQAFAAPAPTPPAAPPAAPATAPGAPPASTATPEQVDEARRRYDRALELMDEGSYDASLLELQRAYSLAPTYRLLYNLGVVSVAAHEYLKAIEYFNRYLAEGGSEVEATRASEVQTQLARLKRRIASISILTDLPGADVTVDDALVGQSPLSRPLTVNAGRHRVTVTLSGYLPSSQTVEVAGNESKSVSFVLNRPGKEPRSHPLPWLAYGVTGALGVATIVTGVLALSAESTYDKTVATLGSSAGDVNSDYRKMRGLSVSADVLLGTTIVAAGISTYLTIKTLRNGGSADTAPKSGFIIRPDGFAF